VQNKSVETKGDTVTRDRERREREREREKEEEYERKDIVEEKGGKKIITTYTRGVCAESVK